MTDATETPAPLTIAEASAVLENAKANLADASFSLEAAIKQKKIYLAFFKKADRDLRTAYQATRKKTGPRKPKEGQKP